MNVISTIIIILTLYGKEILLEAKKNDCYEGSYRHKDSPWREGCPGFRLCEKGYYCSAVVKKKCPKGVYGDSVGLQTSQCSGTCPPGYYCPIGTISPVSNKCGVGYFCPAGSEYPTLIPEGYVGKGADEETFDSIDICPTGSYCQKGVQVPCPGGTYGDITGLSTAECSGKCPMGWYCPLGTIGSHSHPCSNSPTLYCPEGSPSPIDTSLGYYAVESSYTTGGGYGAEIICPPGSYCIGGVRHLCPGGRYGTIPQSTKPECDGPCVVGWYCPPGSIIATEHACGLPNVYCPASSEKPTTVTVGYYTTGSNEDLAHVDVDNENYLGLTRGYQKICEAGYYCTGDGIKRVCPSGHYGAEEGMSSPQCSGQCDQGYYCPPQSTSPQAYQCGGNAFYCPIGSKDPHPVAVGYYTVGGGIATHYAERRCEPGYYCVNGTKHFCIAGNYGDEFGQIVETCTGPCAAGYYCPEGSTSSIEVMCGDATRYCPYGSVHPLLVPAGYYTINGNISTRSDIKKSTRGRYASNGLNYLCPAGRYGVRDGESDPMCSGACEKGFYCPAGSVSPFMRVCGADDVICPPASASPVAVHTGFYTTFEWEEGCKPGTWRNLALSSDPSVPGNSFLPTSKISPPCELCADGHYKVSRGDSPDLCLLCPPEESTALDDRTGCECYRAPGGKFLEDGEFLYFNHTIGECVVLQHEVLPYIIQGIGWSLNTSVNRVTEYECETGHYCIEGVQFPCPETRYGDRTRETDPMCTGDCPEGYYCPRGTSYPLSNICGASYLYCPLGSSKSLFVPDGHYTIGSDSELTRFDFTICETGHYCVDGKKFECPLGTYTDEEGTTDPQCKDLCDPGYYCLTGSPSPRHYACGNASVYCPRGSSVPKSVHNGFYCEITGGSQGADRFWSSELKTCSVELPCEPGSYCLGGERRLCPPGKYGWRYGLNSSECSGTCAPGYYCPSFLEPQPEAPDYTIWPRTSQLQADEYKCGHVGWFCPAGASYPQKVRGGHYSIGGNEDGTTRQSEALCPRGFYCTDGIIIPCPKGSYGSETGQTDKGCSGFCPPAHYCPQGTSDPIPCPDFTYSAGGLWTCNACPGTPNPDAPITCQDDRSCCFRN
mmetsp:Transcript_6735/g.11070  ORF Transcript_6735/g.11070 Transcript_6735/m.11070 type:complete len:1107 (+) Transcript_6735:128-3448(+)